MLPLSPNQLTQQVVWCLQRDEPCVLDEVISLHYDALGYYDTGHACRGSLLNNLSVMLITRFECRGNVEDLDRAIASQRETMALCPVGHNLRVDLNEAHERLVYIWSYFLWGMLELVATSEVGELTGRLQHGDELISPACPAITV
jgi:hypothetical protein